MTEPVLLLRLSLHLSLRPGHPSRLSLDPTTSFMKFLKLVSGCTTSPLHSISLSWHLQLSACDVRYIWYLFFPIVSSSFTQSSTNSVSQCMLGTVDTERYLTGSVSWHIEVQTSPWAQQLCLAVSLHPRSWAVVGDLYYLTMAMGCPGENTWAGVLVDLVSLSKASELLEVGHCCPWAPWGIGFSITERDLGGN